VSSGPFFLSVIHKEDLCPSNGDFNADVTFIYILLTPEAIEESFHDTHIFPKDLAIRYTADMTGGKPVA
jgi:hypothetical protein